MSSVATSDSDFKFPSYLFHVGLSFIKLVQKHLTVTVTHYILITILIYYITNSI